MERDFMGLTVKQEVPEEPSDPVSFRNSAMQWSLSNKLCNLPQYMSFNGAGEDKPKTGFDALASTGLVTITTTEAVDSSLWQNSGAPQNLFGNANVPPLGLLRSPFSAAPASDAVAITTELRNVHQMTMDAAQLTIFYAGSVCVYDNISPEKAHAIMLLAGNGTPATQASVKPVQTQLSMSHATAPCFPSPVLRTSQSGSQSTAGSGNSTNEATVVKTIGFVGSQSIKAEHLKHVWPGSSQAALIPSAVPQARKASLARFLEKRKERVMNASPYMNKQSPDCKNRGNAGQCFSMISLDSSSRPAASCLKTPKSEAV